MAAAEIVVVTAAEAVAVVVIVAATAEAVVAAETVAATVEVADVIAETAEAEAATVATSTRISAIPKKALGTSRGLFRCSEVLEERARGRGPIPFRGTRTLDRKPPLPLLELGEPPG